MVSQAMAPRSRAPDRATQASRSKLTLCSSKFNGAVVGAVTPTLRRGTAGGLQGGLGADDLVDPRHPRLALQGRFRHLPALEVVTDRRVGGLGDEDHGAELLVEPLDPRAGIDAVADDRVLETLARADVADDDLVGVDSDADADRRLPDDGALAVDLGERRLHPEGGQHRAALVTPALVERAEERQHAVADELVED